MSAYIDPTTYSKGRINRAGRNIRDNSAAPEDMEVVNSWRASHAYILNTFQATLRNRSREAQYSVVVAQRLKRLKTIIGKLDRYPNMRVARMHDVAGCRLIFDTIEDLTKFRDDFHTARFRHRLRNGKDDYDYIRSPKNDGYRGIHDVYEYNVRSLGGQKWNGLLLELQFRTIYQHAWATAVEVVGLITQNQPKFNAGDPRYLEFFRLTSEIIARVYEGSRSCCPELSDSELLTRFSEVDHQINLFRTLAGINVANEEVLSGKNVILVFHEDSELEILTYESSAEALQTYFELEKLAEESDVVLVNADSGEAIRSAFRNYFSDTNEFVSLIHDGWQTLTARVSGSV